MARIGIDRLCLGDGAAQESNLPSVGLPRLTGFEDDAVTSVEVV